MKETCKEFVEKHTLDATWEDRYVIGRHRLTSADEIISSYEYTIKHVSIIVSVDGIETILEDDENLSNRYPAGYEI